MRSRVVQRLARQTRITDPDDAMLWAIFGAVWAFVGAELGFAILERLT